MKALYRSLSFVFICTLFINVNLAQDKVNAREFFVEAESYFLFEEYAEALPLYQRILRVEQNNYNVMCKIGVCYLNDPYQKERAIKYLLEASKNINPEYKIKSYKEKQAPPETNYYLGLAYRMNGDISNALKYYEKFENSVDSVIFDIDVVRIEIEACKRAEKTIRTPVYFNKDNAGDRLNSRFAETNAILSGNGKTIVFNRILQFYDAVFIANKNSDGTWSTPYNLTPDFGLDGNSYCTGVSYNGDEIFVYRSDDFDGNIYSSKLIDGVWQKLEKLGQAINTKYWEAHASISSDGKTLYFTSNRKGGYGGLDIYKSLKDANGKWGEAVNLGPVVNSSLNEYTPFVSVDGKKLYFSSLGHTTIGGYDVFVSTLTPGNNWSGPVNMGYPLNTTDDDIFFCPDEGDAFTGIQTIYDPGSTLGLTDIYHLKVYNEIIPRMFLVKGQINVPVKEMIGNKEIKVILIDSETGRIVQQITTDELGSYSFEASQGEYQLLVNGEGIKPVSVPIILGLTQENSSVEIPLITAQVAERSEDEILLTTTELPKLEVEAEDYVITDSIPVVFNLIVEEGGTLSVETYANEILKKREEYLITKEKFRYKFTPEPGENTVVFKVTDKDNNINTHEVKVYFEPKIEEPVAVKELEAETRQISEVTLIASANLKEYLASLKSIEYASISELYQMLLVNAEENNYTEQEVEELINILLTQRDIEEFIDDIQDIDKLNSISSNDTLLEKSKVPIALVKSGKQLETADEETTNTGLIEAVPYKGDNASIASYILTFVDYPVTQTTTFNSDNSDQIYKSLNEQVEKEQATNAIELASTTVPLEEYYHNLLLSTDKEFRRMLSEMDFDSLHINNSIELVHYLVSVAEENNLSKSSVISALEDARKLKNKNILEFKEALANAATGELKLRIQEIDITADGVNELSDIIEILLNDSKSKQYGRTEVYDLLISMIGINDVNEFIDKLVSVSNGKLDKVLSEINRDEYSLPIEVIQYLLSQSPYFDYSDSDINNLLLKMLLEKGIEEWQIVEDESYSENLINKRKRFTTIVLFGLLTIVIILLFRRKKRKSQRN